MKPYQPPALEEALANWPIAISLSECLPVGDLITLARTNINIRAALHGFKDAGSSPNDEVLQTVRRSLNIGKHGTTYWRSLKDSAQFVCSEKTHTKGSEPKPCRYCSRPICETCIVRYSLARQNERIFQNRCRYLCRECWNSGVRSKSSRFPLDYPSSQTTSRTWKRLESDSEYMCNCTLRRDGWLCLDCRDKQSVAVSNGDLLQCHGEGCSRMVDEEDRERRRICLWCDKALPRQLSGATRLVWNQKLIEARARNAASRQADLQEYNRKRLKMMRMSRREMRGDEAVKDDPNADIPQFVRHLDTINYRSFMPEIAAPSGDTVYASKMGYWRYSRDFILSIRGRCTQVESSSRARDFMKENSPEYARTNMEKRIEWRGAKSAKLAKKMAVDNKTDSSTSESEAQEAAIGILTNEGTESAHRRLQDWHHVKAKILELLLYRQLKLNLARQIMVESHDFEADEHEYRKVLASWGVRLKRESVDEQGDNKYIDTWIQLDRDQVLESEDLPLQLDILCPEGQLELSGHRNEQAQKVDSQTRFYFRSSKIFRSPPDDKMITNFDHFRPHFAQDHYGGRSSDAPTSSSNSHPISHEQGNSFSTPSAITLAAPANIARNEFFSHITNRPAGTLTIDDTDSNVAEEPLSSISPISADPGYDPPPYEP